jgi:hypothetical protein
MDPTQASEEEDELETAWRDFTQAFGSVDVLTPEARTQDT